MTRRPGTILLVGLVLTALGFLAWGFVLSASLQVHPRAASEEAPLVGALWQCSMLGFLAVGTLLAGKRRRNPIGWVLLSLPLLFWSGWVLEFAPELALVQGRPLSRAVVELEWLDSAVGTPAMLVAALLLVLLFPDGELTTLGRRLLRIALPLVGVVIVLRLFVPLDDGGLPNPHVVEALVPAADLVEGLTGASAYTLPFAAWDLVRRYRRSRGARRQQFRWVVRSLLAAPVAFAFAQVGDALLSDATSRWTDLLSVWIAFFGIAAGIGVAVLRYRLYDIDRVVSRTVAYLVITAILVGVYVAAVLTLGGLARTVTDGTNDLVVALSTLLVAAAFQPVRRRVQWVVDRRFNRARYDAQRTSESFSQRLRDQVDLGELREDLMGTVRHAVAPATISVWLPPGGTS